jgi:hypothetical protein
MTWTKENNEGARQLLGFTDPADYFEVAEALSPYRSRDPQDLIDSFEAGIDIVQESRNRAQFERMRDDDIDVIAAWGGHRAVSKLLDRPARIVRLVIGNRLRCLGRTAKGEPRHPLMLAYSTPLEVF